MIAQIFDGVTWVIQRNKSLLLPFMTSADTNKDLMFWHGEAIIILARFSIKFRLRHESPVNNNGKAVLEVLSISWFRRASVQGCKGLWLLSSKQPLSLIHAMEAVRACMFCSFKEPKREKKSSCMHDLVSMSLLICLCTKKYSSYKQFV